MNLEDLRRKYLKSGFTPANASEKYVRILF